MSGEDCTASSGDKGGEILDTDGANSTLHVGVGPLSDWPSYFDLFDILETQGAESLFMLQGCAIIQPVGLPAGFGYVAKSDECRAVVVGGRIIGAEWMTNVQELQPTSGLKVLPTAAKEPRPVMYACAEHASVDEGELPVMEGPGLVGVGLHEGEVRWWCNGREGDVGCNHLRPRPLGGHGKCPYPGSTANVKNGVNFIGELCHMQAAVQGEKPSLMLKIYLCEQEICRRDDIGLPKRLCSTLNCSASASSSRDQSGDVPNQ
jgi:hypothetical protein